jgi:hypothetical protein
MSDEPKGRPLGLGYCAGFSGLEGYSAGYTSPIFPQSTGTLPCLGNGIASGRMFAIPQHPERHGMAQARNADRQRSWRTIRPKWLVWRGHDLYQLARTPSIACQTATFVQDAPPLPSGRRLRRRHVLLLQSAGRQRHRLRSDDRGFRCAVDGGAWIWRLCRRSRDLASPLNSRADREKPCFKRRPLPSVTTCLQRGRWGRGYGSEPGARSGFLQSNEADKSEQAERG